MKKFICAFIISLIISVSALADVQYDNSHIDPFINHNISNGITFGNEFGDNNVYSGVTPFGMSVSAMVNNLSSNYVYYWQITRNGEVSTTIPGFKGNTEHYVLLQSTTKAGAYNVELNIMGCNGIRTVKSKTVNVYDSKMLQQGVFKGYSMITHETETNNIKLWNTTIENVTGNYTLQLVGTVGTSFEYKLINENAIFQDNSDPIVTFNKRTLYRKHIGTVNNIGNNLRITAFPFYDGNAYTQLNFTLERVNNGTNDIIYHLDMNGVTEYSVNSL